MCVINSILSTLYQLLYKKISSTIYRTLSYSLSKESSQYLLNTNIYYKIIRRKLLSLSTLFQGYVKYVGENTQKICLPKIYFITNR